MLSRRRLWSRRLVRQAAGLVTAGRRKKESRAACHRSAGEPRLALAAGSMYAVGLSGELWLLCDRTQMAKKCSSACRIGLLPAIHVQHQHSVSPSWARLFLMAPPLYSSSSSVEGFPVSDSDRSSPGDQTRRRKPRKLNRLRCVRLFWPKPDEFSPPVFTLQPQRMHYSAVLRWPLRGRVFWRGNGTLLSRSCCCILYLSIFPPVFLVQLRSQRCCPVGAASI